MLLHRGADVRSSCDVCNVTFQGRVVCAHKEETPHHNGTPLHLPPPTVMELIPRRTMSLIAVLMIAFFVAAAPPPPLPMALVDNAVSGVVPPLSSSSLR